MDELTVGYHINRPPPSASSYSIPRRTLYILKRATAKFPGDLAVWLAYVEYAAREGMTKVVAKGLNSALQHHPLSPTLYLLLSYHHLHPGAPLPRSGSEAEEDEDKEQASGFSLEGTGPARTTLLLGLRLLPQSHVLWCEYVKLELGWVEALRRRWAVLGIAPKEGDAEFDGDAAALAGGDGAFGPEGEDARRAILSGQLVLHALQSGLKKVTPESKEKSENGVVTGMDFRDTMLTVLRTYPSPLRTKAIAAIYSDLEAISSRSDAAGAHARLLLITRPLYDLPYESGESAPTENGIVLSGAELVDAIGKVGQRIRKEAKVAGPDFAGIAGSWLADRIDDTTTAELQHFLFATLSALTKPSLSPPAPLLVRHLALTRTLDPKAYLSTSRSHASQHPTSPALQLARVVAETSDNSDNASVVCAEAARAVTVSGLAPEDQDLVLELWRTWGQYEAANGRDRAPLLRESLRLGAGIPALHPSMLAEHFSSLLESGNAQDSIKSITKTYSPSAVFYDLAFDQLTARGGSKEDLNVLYTRWRGVCKSAEEKVDAVLKWTKWLLERGDGRDAALARDVVLREVRGTDQEERLEVGWKLLLDGEPEQAEEEDEDMESESDSDSGDEDGEEDDESMSEGDSGDLDIAM